MDIFASVWSALWSLVVIFAFVAYLMALFTIFSDIFRDSALSGWAKAGWVLFLFVVPFIAALVYLIARGKGMAERQSALVNKQVNQTEDYIRSVAAVSPAESIAKAKELLDAGTITDAEFQALKAKALAG